MIIRHASHLAKYISVDDHRNYDPMQRQHEHDSVNKQIHMSERSHKDLRIVNGDHMHDYYHAVHSQIDMTLPVEMTDKDTTNVYDHTVSGTMRQISI